MSHDSIDVPAGERKPLGEIVSTSYSSFTVESYELNSTPPLGALVVAQDVLGVVCSARTEALGTVSVLGNPEDEDGWVYREYPDLQRILRSQFKALVVGCYMSASGNEGDRDAKGHTAGPVYTYPECPPRVHYKCWLASDSELVQFTARPDYLNLLLDVPEPDSVDQVIVHLIVRAFRARGRDRNWLLHTAEYLGRQLKGEYDRLLALLKTLDALTQERGQPSSGVADSVGRIRL